MKRFPKESTELGNSKLIAEINFEETERISQGNIVERSQSNFLRNWHKSGRISNRNSKETT